MKDLAQKQNKYTRLSKEERQKKRKWLARQSEANQLDAFKLQKKYLFELSRFKDEDKSILYYAAHTLAADELYNRMYPQKGKSKVSHLNEVNDNTETQANNIKKQTKSPQMDWLLDRKAKIIGWSKNNLSTREIERAIKKHYEGKKVSHVTINDFLNSMKE